MHEDITIPVLPVGSTGLPDEARTLAARIELAVAMGQHQVAAELYRRLTALPLSDTERRRIREEFAVLDRLLQ